MTWEQMRKKYPEYRHEMNTERELEFVSDCFECYEAEGFAKRFYSPFGDYGERIGKPFEVIGRVPVRDEQHKDGADLECLPMWRIRFEDGFELSAYPEECIPSEMIDNGCPKSFFEEEQ